MAQEKIGSLSCCCHAQRSYYCQEQGCIKTRVHAVYSRGLSMHVLYVKLIPFSYYSTVFVLCLVLESKILDEKQNHFHLGLYYHVFYLAKY